MFLGSDERPICGRPRATGFSALADSHEKNPYDQSNHLGRAYDIPGKVDSFSIFEDLVLVLQNCYLSIGQLCFKAI